MTMDDRERAQRVSDYADSLVVSRRVVDERRSAVFESADREFWQLAEIAEALTAIRIEPPPGTEADVARRIRELEARPRESGLIGDLFDRWGERWRAEWSRMSRLASLPIAKPITAVIVNLVVIAVAIVVLRSPSASAAEILLKTDAALANLVKPGKVLFRRWRIVDRIRDRPGAAERIERRLLLEWIDGSNIRHATGRSVSASGRTYLAYLNAPLDGSYVPRIYYEPGYAGEARGLLSIVPSSEEFDRAAQRFSGTARRILETYLARGYIYEPIFSERRFNEAMLKDVTGIEPLQRVRLSMEHSEVVNGRPVFKVRSSDDVRLQFRWRSEGPPVMWLERQETVRYISKDTYLAVKSEEVHLDERGARTETTRELVEASNLDASAGGPDPFTLPAGEDVPVRRQSAEDHLMEVLRALRRVPQFLGSQTH